jgi:uncharacterized protein YegL
VVLADVSQSMQGEAIEALERGFAAFTGYLHNDPVASKRVEVAVVTFGTAATVLVPMQEARTLAPARFTAAGSTNMAAGIHLVLDIIEDRKQAYKMAGLQYYRPWILALTDGKANLGGFEEAVSRLNAAETASGVTVFAVGVGPKVDYQQLGRLSVRRGPAPLDGVRFEALFEWLSASLTSVSNSTEYGRDDDALGAMSDKISLPSISGWTTA